MMAAVKENPTMFISEIKKKVAELTGKTLANSTLSMELNKRLKLTLKKSRGVDPRQSPVDRARFVAKVAGVPAEYFVFIGACSKLTYPFLASY